ncbi:MAG: hypothetical protein CBB71_16700 [Rhodopirellula sp. TMED11]|nr:MAG: hypothetical protein CBB71_16700 [Rhodopirellula sp. TMED11]
MASLGTGKAGFVSMGRSQSSAVDAAFLSLAVSHRRQHCRKSEDRPLSVVQKTLSRKGAHRVLAVIRRWDEGFCDAGWRGNSPAERPFEAGC